MDEIVIFITAPNEDEAARIARELVRTKLAGCVNIIRNIRSIFAWEGKIEDDAEVLMIAKSTKSLFPQIVKKTRELHSYSVPEIIALPLAEGSQDYLKWLESVTA